MKRILATLRFISKHQITEKYLLGLLLVSFVWLGEKNSPKYSLIGGGRSSPLVQTVSASLMSKLVKKSGRRSLTNKIFLKNILWICQKIKNSLLRFI